MKKLIALCCAMLIFCGCSLGKEMSNTPTKKVEEFLSKYQTLDDDVLESLNNVIDEDIMFNATQRENYRDLMKKHYKNLTYEIKDEKIDGDKATVTAEIEVTDYTKILEEASKTKEKNPEKFHDDNKNIDESKFLDYRLEKLKDASDTVKYTVDFKLTKEDDTWKLEPLSNENEQKIHGMYTKERS